MTPPLTIDIPHQLGRTEARRRIETGFARSLARKRGSLLLAKK